MSRSGSPVENDVLRSRALHEADESDESSVEDAARSSSLVGSSRDSPRDSSQRVSEESSQDSSQESVLRSSPDEQSHDEEDRAREQVQGRQKAKAHKKWNQETHDLQLLAASLAQDRARDLSVHLYNAHALKRRLHDSLIYAKGFSWAAKESWIPELDPPVKGARGRPGYPRTSWTAWPMPPDIVPREGEKVGWDRDDEDDHWTFKREETVRPSRVLEEVLTASILKAAKERFESREREDVKDHTHGRTGVAESSHDEMREEIDPSGVPESNENQAKLDPRHKRPGVASGFQKPIVTADDDEACQLARQTVRHLLSKLDDLLMGLHHARQAYLASGNEAFKCNEEKRKATRAASDSRKRITSVEIDMREVGVSTERSADRDTELESHTPTRKKERGRPRKYGKPMDGESYHAMRRRIIKAQAKALNVESNQDYEREAAVMFEGVSFPLQSFSSRKRPRRSSSPSQLTARQAIRHRRLGLRDWSDVLGMASLTGWDEAVVSRTAERCAKLFGEGIRFRTLQEERATFPRRRMQEDSGTVEYAPEEIPSPEPSSASEDDISSPETLRPRVSLLPSGAKAFHCPYSSCERHVASEGPFTNLSNLKRHLKLVHQLEDQTLLELDTRRLKKQLQPDDDDDMLGAVHVDGFLQPIHTGRGSGSRRPKAENKTNLLADGGDDYNTHADRDGDEDSEEAGDDD